MEPLVLYGMILLSPNAAHPDTSTRSWHVWMGAAACERLRRQDERGRLRLFTECLPPHMMRHWLDKRRRTET